MSSIFQRGSRYWLKVPRRTGGWANRSTGTADRKVAARMARLVDELKDRREWALLDALASGRLTAGELYDAHVRNGLAALASHLADPDLRAVMEEWLQVGAARWSAERPVRYRRQVSAFFEPRDWKLGALTVREVGLFLASLDVSASTARTYHAALSGFCAYLVQAELIAHNPLHDVRAPAAAPPRDRHLTHDEVLLLVREQPAPYAALSALMHATGAEISAALRLIRRDLFEEDGRLWVHLRGTKTQYRDRRVPLEPWARREVERHIADLLPEAPLFPQVNRWTASDQHRAACVRLGFDSYRLHDARHTFAVRAVRAGASFEAVARLLGHGSTAMAAKVYARFVPSRRELTDWQDAAAKRDRSRRKAG